MDGILLGSYGEPEQLLREIKEYHLNLLDIHSQLRKCEIHKIVSTGVWNDELSQIHNNNLGKYIETIVPKYFACFGNIRKDGELVIGINDITHEITGIPFLDEIPYKLIEDSLNKTISENISCTLSPDELKELVSYTVTELKIDTDVLEDDAGSLLIEYSKKIITYNNKMDEYKTKRLAWLQQICRYKQKLEIMLNITDLRLELKDYIKTNAKYEDVKHLIDELMSDNFIPLVTEDIYHHRNDKKRIFYWVAKFRDHMTNEIVKRKVDKPILPVMFYPEQILAKLPTMRYKFVKNGVKYFILKINFVGSVLKEKIEFKYPGTDKWYYRKRIQCIQGPSCI